MPDGASTANPQGPRTEDPYDLQRFVRAQEPVIDHAREELRAGRKTSHWMWFVFPRLRGLGFSTMAQFYGIASEDEAVAYLDHAVMGPRLIECTGLVLSHHGRSLHAIFGSPDDMKFHSCMTLFHVASTGREPVLDRALQHYFEGRRDPKTLSLLGRNGD
jgi:uncharacterized protein (DUF1810 family)